MAVKRQKGETQILLSTERISNRLDRVLIAESRERFTRSKVSRAGMAVLLVAVVGGIGGYYGLQAMSSKDHTIPSIVKPVTPDTLASVAVDLDARARKGDVEGALEEYDKRIEVSDDTKVKRSLLIKQATLALKHGKLDAAIRALHAAESEDSDYTLFAPLAKAYEKKKDYAKAAEYYQKAADDKLSPRNYGAKRYQAKAAELRRLAGE